LEVPQGICDIAPPVVYHSKWPSCVVYTPNEIVRFMIDSADWLCQKHFGKSLIDKQVEILDPWHGGKSSHTPAPWTDWHRGTQASDP
jgi:hypothetical protein